MRQLAQRLGGYGGLALVGTPATIADEMEEWLATARLRRLQRDVPAGCPAGSTISSTRWCRNCSAAACSAREYEGTTLRDHLGLPRPENRFFPQRAAAE